MRKFSLFVVLAAMSSPVLASAEVPAEVKVFMSKILDTFVNPIIILMFGLATMNLIMVVVKYAFNRDKMDTNKLKDSLVWSVIGVAIMASVFGIEQFVISSLKSAGVETLGGN